MDDAKQHGAQARALVLSKAIMRRVARLYNAVISSIIEGTDQWTLKNGYRNILATIGITQDGKMRNIIGQEAERAVRDKLSEWIVQAGIPCERQERWFVLGAAKTVRMAYMMKTACPEPAFPV